MISRAALSLQNLIQKMVIQLFAICAMGTKVIWAVRKMKLHEDDTSSRLFPCFSGELMRVAIYIGIYDYIESALRSVDDEDFENETKKHLATYSRLLPNMPVVSRSTLGSAASNARCSNLFHLTASSTGVSP